MKIAMLSYHKNAETLYPAHWIEKYKNSVLNQTYKQFDIIEANYGGGDYRIFEHSIFDAVITDNFVQTLNRLLDKCFNELEYDFVLNSNIDDWFTPNRVERHIPFMSAGYDLISSNFALVKDDEVTKWHKFHNLNILQELTKNHNIVCHPACTYSKKFWENNRYVPEQIPTEDLQLWQRAIKNSKFIILEDTLLFHRVHSQSVCQSENR